jgi:hypothetical protein
MNSGRESWVSSIRRDYEGIETVDAIRGHQLPTAELRSLLPPLYGQEEKGMDAIAHVKFFTPDSSWTWYASKFNGEARFSGFAMGHEIELGYFSLSEFQSVVGPLGLPIEREPYFTPETIGDLMRKHEQERVSR